MMLRLSIQNDDGSDALTKGLSVVCDPKEWMAQIESDRDRFASFYLLGPITQLLLQARREGKC